MGHAKNNCTVPFELEQEGTKNLNKAWYAILLVEWLAMEHYQVDYLPSSATNAFQIGLCTPENHQVINNSTSESREYQTT